MTDRMHALKTLRMLLVEDTEADMKAFRRAFRETKYPCEIVHSQRAEEALERLRFGTEAFDVVVIDHGLPDMSGMDLARELLRLGKPLPMVMLTGGGSEHLAVEALKSGLDDYVIKDAEGTYLEVLPILLPQVIKRDAERRAREAAEEALRESQELFRRFMNNSPCIAYLKDDEGRYVYVNEPFERFFNMRLEDWQGRTDFELWPPETARQMRENDLAVLQAGKSLEMLEVIPQADGPHHWMTFKFVIEDAQRRRFVGGMAVDITEARRAEDQRRRMESQVQHVQKLESLGALAGGIAHEFNNILVGILGNTGLALLDVPPESEARKLLMDVEAASLRAANLTAQMLAYSGKAHMSIRPTDLSRLVEDMASLLEVAASRKVELHCEVADNLPQVEADSGQLRQVIMNLVTNAAEAVADKGVVRVRTGSMEASESYLAQTVLSEGLSPGQYAYIEVSDTGTGMDSATQARMFEPFFSTRFAGRGLGLAAVLGIVRGHRGTLHVTSSPGRGTTIRVLFPATRPAARAAAPATADSSAWRGEGTVLIADDEAVVRNVAARSLERAGFRVLSASDGVQAVDLFRKNAADVVAVILDVTMPHVDGGRAFLELREISPDVPILMSSGYDEGEALRALSGHDVQFLKKPYRPAELVAAVRDAIDPPGPDGRRHETPPLT